MNETPITIAPVENGEAAAELMRRLLPYDRMTPERFQRQVLNDPNFRPEGALAATLRSETVGFCLAIARQVPLENAPPDHERGYITLLGVAPDYQGRGIGSRLLENAEAFLKAQGRREIWISPYSPGYFTPGVDMSLHAHGLSFLKRRGYREVYRPLAMELSLVNLETPDWVLNRRRGLATEGVQVGPISLPGGWEPLLEFIQREFPGDWVRVARETAAEITQGTASPDRLMVAKDETGAVLGFSHHNGERFGPIGVAPAQRGRGIGQLLMYATLNAQREAAFGHAYFLWTDDRTAERFYKPAGFQETRRFAVLKKELEECR